MSNLIDERIVEMSFDNKNFEKNVKTSMDTIEDLKSSLNFSGVSSSINKNLNSVDTSGLSEGLSIASQKFTAMEIIAITALANITNRVIDLGLELIKSLSIDNISAGWDKFGEKATAVSTLVAQGYDMDTINAQLEKLGWFTDETSYAFSDMVSNIGKFTASGQSLEDSVQAMMGIANWAALSGQNATTASRAMYQLAQSLGKGSVQLADWKSIQNANMDTKEFRQMALDAAVAAGELSQTIDGMYITKSGNMFGINQFTEYLTSDGWFSTNILMDTLGQYSAAVDQIYEITQNDESINTTSQAIAKYGDELDGFGLKAFKAAQEAKTFKEVIDATKEAVSSQWANTFENIFGGYDKAKVLWTDLANELYDVFVDGLNVNNQILKGWHELGGHNDLFINTEDETGAFWNLFYAIVELKNLISNAWRIIFPFSEMEEGEERIDDITNKLKNFTAWLKESSKNLYLSEESAEAFTNILKGMFSLLKLFFKILGAVWTGIQPVLGLIKELAGQLIGLLSIAGDKFSEFVGTTNIFVIAGQRMADVLTIIINEIRSFNIIENLIKMVTTMTTAFKQNGGTSENLSRTFAGLKAILGLLLQAFVAVYGFVKKYIFPVLGSLLMFSAKLVGAFGGKILSAFAWLGDLTVRFVKFIRTSESLNKIFSIIKKGFSSMITAMSNFFGSFKKVDTTGVDEFNEDIEKKFNPLETILSGLASLFSGLWSIIQVFIPVISKALGFIGKAFKKFAGNLTNTFGGDGGTTLSKILTMGFVVYVAKSIMDVLHLFKGIKNAITDVIGSFGDLVYSKALMQYAEALKTMAIAIIILVAALILISSIDDEQLQKSMSILILIMSTMVAMVAIMKKIMTTTSFLGVQSVITAYSMKLAAESLIKIVIAVALLALVLKLLGSMEHDQMMQGLTGITMLIGILLGVAAIVSKNSKKFKKGASGLLSMAIAVLLLSIPLKRIGTMEPKTLIQGMAGIAALVGLCIIFAKVSGQVKKAVTAGLGMILFAHALLIASIPLLIIGNMGWSKLFVGITGLLAVAGVMILLGTLSRHFKKAILASMTMMIMSQALLIASLPLVIIGNMGWSKMLAGVTGILGIAGVMILLGTLSRHFKKAILASMTMVVIAGALLIASIPLLVIGHMGWSKMLTGVTGILGIAGVMILLGTLSRHFKKAILASMTMNLIGTSLLIASIPFLIIGHMGWSKMLAGVTGILGIAGVMILLGTLSRYMKKAIVMAFAMNLMGLALIEFSIAAAILGSMKFSSLLKAGAAILGLALIMVFISKIVSAKTGLNLIAFALSLSIMSVSLLLFAAAMGVLSLISYKTLGKVLLIIVGAFIVFGVAALLLKPVLPVLLGLSVALLMFATAVLIISVALSILTVTLGLFGASLAMVLKFIAEAIIEAAPMIALAIGALLSAIFQALTLAIDDLFILLNVLITKILDFLWAHGPRIIDTVLMLLVALIVAIANYFPTIVDSLIKMVIDLLKALRENIAEIIDIVIDILLRVIEAITKRVPEIINKLGNLAITIIESLVKKLIELTPRIINAGFDLILGLIKGLGNAIKNRAVEIRETMIQFCKDILDAILIFFGMKTPDGESKSFLDIGKNLIKALINGMKKVAENIWDEIKDIGDKVVSGFKKIFGIKSPSRVFMEIGNYLDEGLAKGIHDNADKVYNSAESLGDDVLDGINDSGMKTALQGLSKSLENDMNSDVVIRPVFDLTEIQNGKNAIFGMMQEVDGYEINGSNNTANQTAKSISSTKKESIGQDLDKNKKNQKETQTNNYTFNITEKGSPKEVAEEVSKIIQTQIDRRKIQHGKPNI